MLRVKKRNPLMSGENDTNVNSTYFWRRVDMNLKFSTRDIASSKRITNGEFYGVQTRPLIGMPRLWIMDNRVFGQTVIGQEHIVLVLVMVQRSTVILHGVRGVVTEMLKSEQYLQGLKKQWTGCKH